MSRNTTKLFPDVRTILADAMTSDVYNGLTTELSAHYQAAKKNHIPPAAAHVAALDAAVRVMADLIVNVVPAVNHAQAIAETVSELEKYVSEKQAQRDGKK